MPSANDAECGKVVVHPHVLCLTDADGRQFAIMFADQDSQDAFALGLVMLLKTGIVLNLRRVDAATVSKDIPI